MSVRFNGKFVPKTKLLQILKLKNIDDKKKNEIINLLSNLAENESKKKEKKKKSKEPRAQSPVLEIKKDIHTTAESPHQSVDVVVIGRRITDISYLADSLVCKKCEQLLHIKFIKYEVRYGVCSVYTIECQTCKTMNLVASSEEIVLDGVKCYRVNVDLILGMLDAGKGPSHSNSFLTTLNIPAVSENTYQKLLTIVEKPVYKATEKSCERVVVSEIKETLDDREWAKNMGLVNKEDINIEGENDIKAGLVLSTTTNAVINVTSSPLSDISHLQNIQLINKNNEKETPKSSRHTSILNAQIIKNCVNTLQSNCADVSLNLDDQEHVLSLQNVQEELKAASEASENKLSNAVVQIAASSDGAWLKRGNGKSNDSKAGHVCLVGAKTRKVIDYRTRSTDCAGCRTEKEHRCVKNWSGSAKAMEGDMTAEIVKSSKILSKFNARVSTLVSDDDSVSIKKVRDAVEWPVIKKCDTNHALKNFKNLLYSRGSAYKKYLDPAVINYIRYCAACAIKQNKNDSEAVRKAILNIPKHIFDEHDECGPWCKDHTEDEYKHKRLPEDFGGNHKSQIRQIIEEVCNIFANKADGLAACADSQANESVNNTIASKYSKRVHYAKSCSFPIRVAIGVLQFNEGVCYQKYIWEEMKQASNIFAINHKTYVALKRKRQIAESKTSNAKRLRNLRKNGYKVSVQRKERKEGVTYSSGMIFDNESNVMANNSIIIEPKTSASLLSSTSNASPTLITTNNATSSPVATTTTTAPKVRRRKCFQESSDLYKPVSEAAALVTVIFDVETTGTAEKDQIIQISAVTDDKELNIYIQPTILIPKEATNIHKISFANRTMYHKGSVVPSTNRANALQEFIYFLKQTSSQVLLVAHNVAFDAKFILKELAMCNLLEEFNDVVAGFADTWPLFTDRLSLPHYTLTDVTKAVLGENFNFDSHNSLADCKSLKLCLKKLDVTTSHLHKYSATVNSFQQHANRIKELKALNCIKVSKIITLRVIKSLLNDGLNANKLRELIRCKNETEAIKTLEKYSSKHATILYHRIKCYL